MASRTVREYICVVLSHQTPANLLQQQQEANTVIESCLNGIQYYRKNLVKLWY